MADHSPHLVKNLIKNVALAQLHMPMVWDPENNILTSWKPFTTVLLVLLQIHALMGIAYNLPLLFQDFLQLYHDAFHISKQYYLKPPTCQSL